MIVEVRMGERDALQFKLAGFEGPLDLLLHLIQRDEIDVHDIPISHITHQYLEMIQAMRLLDLDVAGEFLVMAATLMRIKARLLLPPSPLDPAEEGAGDPRAELIHRLLEYRKFKEVSLTLREREEHRSLVHPKGYRPRVVSDEPLPLKPISLFQLLDALKSVLARHGEEAVHEVALPPVTVEEKMAEIRLALRQAWGQLRFAEVAAACRTKLEVIATFIALLELVRLGDLGARQFEAFGDIWLFSRERLAGEAWGEARQGGAEGVTAGAGGPDAAP